MALFLSPALVVSPSEVYDATRPRVGWHNLVLFNNVSADSETLASPASNVANPATSQKWVSNSIATQYITVVNLSGEIDYVGIVRHNHGTAGATISVEGITAVSSPAFVEIFPGVIPANDHPLMLQFARDNYSSIRIKIIPNGEAPQIGVLHVGLLTTLPIGIQPGFTPPSAGYDADRVSEWSESGEFLGAIIVGSRLTSSPSFQDIDPDLYDTDFAPFVEHGNHGGTFFFAWSPVDHPSDVSYCWFSGAANPVINKKTGHKDLRIQMGATNL